ncbi:MAG: archease [Candidatus Omnitrophica bacterium]|nr:archease [Candidatus Omnitrophota bacterium]
MENYEVFEHTADIGIRVKGKDLKSLFKNAGLAIFRISSRRQFTKNKTHTRINLKISSDNLEGLFIDWLNELLSLSASRGLIFHNIKIDKLEDNAIEAIALGSDINNYKVNTEIKAATYHQLKVAKNAAGWQAEVILDV